MKKILVVAVHPDDETLGCGGTLLKHKKKGDRTYWLIATEAKEEDGFPMDFIIQREKEIEAVSAAYGFDGIHCMKLSPTKIDKEMNWLLIQRIKSVVDDIQPEIIYLPFRRDVHSDHRMVFDACFSVLKQFRAKFVKAIYMMEVLSETEFAPALQSESFIPNVFVDISEYLNKKIEIMKLYQSELGTHPFPRSEDNIKALATYRGATAGCRYAESFMLLKEIK